LSDGSLQGKLECPVVHFLRYPFPSPTHFMFGSYPVGRLDILRCCCEKGMLLFLERLARSPQLHPTTATATRRPHHPEQISRRELAFHRVASSLFGKAAGPCILATDLWSAGFFSGTVCGQWRGLVIKPGKHRWKSDVECRAKIQREGKGEHSTFPRINGLGMLSAGRCQGTV